MTIPARQPQLGFAIIPQQGRCRREHGWSVKGDPHAFARPEHRNFTIISGGFEKLPDPVPQWMLFGIGKVGDEHANGMWQKLTALLAKLLRGPIHCLPKMLMMSGLKTT
jgi:hypothetical protein